MSLIDLPGLIDLVRGWFVGSRRRVEQPIPDVTSNDVERVVRREFPDEQFAEVMALLNEYGTQKWQRGVPRVQLATLKLAQGSVEKLRTLVESTKRDYRDVLVWAEYPAYHKIGFRVRELPIRKQREIIDSDWKQYEEWLRK
jgi:hypothetical protein